MTSIFGQPGLLGQNSPKIAKKPAFFTCFYFKSFQSKYDPLKTVFLKSASPSRENPRSTPENNYYLKRLQKFHHGLVHILN